MILVGGWGHGDGGGGICGGGGVMMMNLPWFETWVVVAFIVLVVWVTFRNPNPTQRTANPASMTGDSGRNDERRDRWVDAMNVASGTEIRRAAAAITGYLDVVTPLEAQRLRLEAQLLRMQIADRTHGPTHVDPLSPSPFTAFLAQWQRQLEDAEVAAISDPRAGANALADVYLRLPSELEQLRAAMDKRMRTWTEQWRLDHGDE